MRESWSSRFGAYTIFTQSKMCWSARDSRAIQITGMLKVETRPNSHTPTHDTRTASIEPRHAQPHTSCTSRARTALVASRSAALLGCAHMRACTRTHAHGVPLPLPLFGSRLSALGSRLSALGSRLPHTTRQTHAHVRTYDPHARPPTRQRMRALFDGRRTRLTPLTRLTRRRALRHAPRAPPSSPRGIS